jgi:putative membrane protein
MNRIVFLLMASAAAAGCARTQPAVAPVEAVAAAPAVDVNSPLYAPMFLQTAASSNLWEMQSSEIAHPRAISSAIHSFATMITNDHTALGAQMMAAAQAAGLPPPPQALMPDDQQMLAQLQAAPTGTFDVAYRDMQVAAHQKAVNLFQSYAASGDNPTLRATAAQALPKLQQHLAMAQALQVSVAPQPAQQAPRPGERG